MFDGNGVLKAIDFGESTELPDKTAHVRSSMTCTELYTPPEEVKSRQYSAAKDIYSFG